MGWERRSRLNAKKNKATTMSCGKWRVWRYRMHGKFEDMLHTACLPECRKRKRVHTYIHARTHVWVCMQTCMVWCIYVWCLHSNACISSHFPTSFCRRIRWAQADDDADMHADFWYVVTICNTHYMCCMQIVCVLVRTLYIQMFLECRMLGACMSEVWRHAYKDRVKACCMQV